MSTRIVQPCNKHYCQDTKKKKLTFILQSLSPLSYTPTVPLLRPNPKRFPYKGHNSVTALKDTIYIKNIIKQIINHRKRQNKRYRRKEITKIYFLV